MADSTASPPVSLPPHDMCACEVGDLIEGPEEGTFSTYQGVSMYSAKAVGQVKGGVVMVMDIFGFDIPNNRMLVDLIARNGYHCVCADAFDGKPWVWGANTATAEFGAWVGQNDPRNYITKYLEPSKALLREMGAEKLYITGFCWGGRVVHALGWDDKQAEGIVAGVSFYGIFNKDGKPMTSPTVAFPTLFTFGGSDGMFSMAMVNELAGSLPPTCAVTSYEGQGHAFANRKKSQRTGDADDQAQQTALREMFQWFEAPGSIQSRLLQ